MTVALFEAFDELSSAPILFGDAVQRVRRDRIRDQRFYPRVLIGFRERPLHAPRARASMARGYS
jgi:hypothetical protein